MEQSMMAGDIGALRGVAQVEDGKTCDVIAICLIGAVYWSVVVARAGVDTYCTCNALTWTNTGYEMPHTGH
jgi:hypothetical protein